MATSFRLNGKSTTVDVAPDTLTIVGGGTGTGAVRLGRGGLAGLDVVLEFPSLPGNLLLVPPAFSRDVNERDSTDLVLRIDPGAPAGVYPLTLCARIQADPRERCHEAEVVVRVPPVTERYDLAIASQARRRAAASESTPPPSRSPSPSSSRTRAIVAPTSASAGSSCPSRWPT